MQTIDIQERTTFLGDGADIESAILLSANVVQKNFHSHYNCENAYKRSLRAYEYGIGARVFDYDGDCSFCQEYVFVISNMPYEVKEKYGNLIRIERGHLANRFIKSGICGHNTNFVELHIGNIGWTKDGQFVCIDFGDRSSSNLSIED